MIYIIYAILGAIFTSLTNILAKIGLKKVDSNLATLIKTSIVIFFSLLIAFLDKSIFLTNTLTLYNWLFIILSGLSTGLSWLFYFKALKLGNINKVAPIDKSSFILTSILFLIFFFESTTHNGDILTIIMLVVSMVLMLIGTILMIDKKDVENKKESKKWLIFAILSAVFAALVSFFIKFGLSDIPSSLITFYRTIVVFIFALFIVISKKNFKEIKTIDKKSWLFLIFCGLATGLAWLFEYASLANSVINPIVASSISKLSILLTMFLSFIILKEKFSIKSLIGLGVLTSGIILIIVFGL